MENIDFTATKVFEKKKHFAGFSSVKGLGFGRKNRLEIDFSQFAREYLSNKKEKFCDFFYKYYGIYGDFASCECCGTPFKYSNRMWWKFETYYALCKRCDYEVLNTFADKGYVFRKYENGKALALKNRHDDIMRKIRLSY